MRKYTTLDPSSDSGKQQLVGLLMGQSNPDIRKRLQKIKEPDNRDLETLMGEAWRVYNKREKKKHRKLTRVVVALTQNPRYPGPSIRDQGRDQNTRGRGGFPSQQARIRSDECSYCLQTGHWK